MPFFEPLPPEPDPSAPVPTGWVPPAWDRPSEAILGAPVPTSALLAKTDDLALAFNHRYWCFPLPPAGPMRVWTEWQARDFPESSVTVDAGPIRDAAARAVTLWEWTPDRQ